MGYETPQLTDYGSVEDLTAQNGTQIVDSPLGTPIGDGAGDPSGFGGYEG